MVTRLRKGLAIAASAALLAGTFSVLLSAMPMNTLAVHSQCSDGKDNDHDTKSDYPQDDDCESLDDDYEGLSTSGLFVSITDDKNEVQPGGNMVYVITLKQQRDDQRIVNIVMHVPHQVNVMSASDGGNTTVIGQVRWTNVSVYKNVTKVIQVNANLSPYADVGQYIVARVQSEGAEGTDTTLVKEYQNLPQDSSIFKISLSDGAEYVVPGDTLRYTINVKNISDTARRAELRVDIPGVAEYVASGQGAVHDHRNIMWKDLTLDAGEQKQLTFSLRVTERTQDRLLVVTKAYIGAAMAVDRTVARIGLPYNAISASITDNHASAEVDELLTYRVHVTNNSDTVGTNVSVNASLPLYGEFVSATEGGRWDGSNVRWLILQIAPKSSRDLSYTVRVRNDALQGASLLASVTADGYTARDTTVVSRRSTADGVTSRRSSNVLFSKIADRSEATPGSRIRYTLRVRNTLDRPINDAIITDRFDGTYLKFDSASDSTDMISSSAGETRWRVPFLAPGQSWEVSYTLVVARTVPHGIDLSNMASISGTDISNLSLSEKVTTVRTGVFKEFPETGAGMDAILAGILPLMALASTGMHRRKILGF